MSPFNPLDHEIGFDPPERLTTQYTWQRHIPAAFTLIDLLQPELFIELGTKHGDSYCAFCQAVQRLRLPTRGYGILASSTIPDTNHEPGTAYQELCAYHDLRYASFSALIHVSMDTAAHRFADHSVDLLHIPAPMGYEALSHSFDAWRPKLSTRAVVLIHGTATLDGTADSGIARFWREVCLHYESAEFPHSEGLGILLIGPNIPRGVKNLCVGGTEGLVIKRFFAQRGAEVVRGYRRSARIVPPGGSPAPDSIRTIQPQFSPVAHLAPLGATDHGCSADTLRAELQRAVTEYARIKTALSTAQRATRTLQAEALAARAETERADSRRARATAAARITLHAMQEQLDARQRAADTALSTAGRAIALTSETFRRQLAEARAREVELEVRLDTADQQLAALEDKHRAREEDLAAERARALDLESRVTVYTHSLSWRITRPLRALRWIQLRVVGAATTGSGTYVLRPGPEVHPGTGAHTWTCQTHDAWFVVQGTVPGGWVHIQYEFAGDPGARPVCYVSQVGHGLSEYDRIPLPAPVQGIVSALLHLPPHVALFRLDPVDRPGEFTVANFRIRQLSKGAVGRQLLRAFLAEGPVWSQVSKLMVPAVRGRWATVKRQLLDTMDRGRSPASASYEEWALRYDTLNDSDRVAIRAHVLRLSRRPRFSVVMPVYNTDPRWLRAAIQSVRDQLYEDWELCIADDHSDRREVRAVLEEYATQDHRIKIRYRTENGHIAVASNTALSLASGDFVVLLDHDDVLAEHALYMLAVAVNEHPDAGILYSDEDKLDEGGARYDPYFKSAWNTDLMRAQNMISHLGAYCRDLLVQIGGFRPQYVGSQDYDLALRASERLQPGQIIHLPYILYHWRAAAGSTAAAGDAKPYTTDAARQALVDHLARRAIAAVVLPAEIPFYHHVVYTIPNPPPKVSAIVPTRNGIELLRRCIDTLRLARYPALEIIVVDNGSDDRATLDYLNRIGAEPGVSVLPYNGDFNFSTLNNHAASVCSGQVLLFVNNDVEAMDREWLRELVRNVCRPEVGVVGAALYYQDRTLQHGGVILGLGGVASHAHKRLPWGATGHQGRALLAQEFSAVTAACMAMRQEVFDQVGGFDQQHLPVAFNDVDLCLRVREAGYSIVWTPYARLYHHESASRGADLTAEKARRFESERQYMVRRWGATLLNDPYYNPNLTLDREDFSLAWPPRTVRPWEHRAGGDIGSAAVGRTATWSHART